MSEAIRSAAIKTLGDVYVAGKDKPKYSGFDALSCHDGDPISVYALKMAYRKHAKHDESIGWNELHDILGNALAQIMGDDEFVEWNEGIKESLKVNVKCE